MVPTAAINLDVNRCLAHIINIATQALISTRSKAKYYDSSAQEAELSDIYADMRDEVGLIWAICIKVSLLLFMKFIYLKSNVPFRQDHYLSGRSYFIKFKFGRA